MDTIIDKNVEIEVSEDGKKLWVNVNGLCRLRVDNRFFKSSITINDKRKQALDKNDNS